MDSRERYVRDGTRSLEVWDQYPALPVIQALSLDAEGGRGLAMLERLVARLGVRPLFPEGSGKIVFVEFLDVHPC